MPPKLLMSVFVVTTFLPRAFDVDDVAVAAAVTDVCVARRPTSIRYLTNIMDPIN